MRGINHRDAETPPTEEMRKIAIFKRTTPFNISFPVATTENQQQDDVSPLRLLLAGPQLQPFTSRTPLLLAAVYRSAPGSAQVEPLPPAASCCPPLAPPLTGPPAGVAALAALLPVQAGGLGASAPRELATAR